METYTVDGRTFRVGELCLVRRWVGGTHQEWVPGRIAPQPATIEYWVVATVDGPSPDDTDWWYFRPQDVLLLSENFSPGM